MREDSLFWLEIAFFPVSFVLILARVLHGPHFVNRQTRDNPLDLPDFLTKSVNHFTLGGTTIGSSGDFGGIGW